MRGLVDRLCASVEVLKLRRGLASAVFVALLLAFAALLVLGFYHDAEAGLFRTPAGAFRILGGGDVVLLEFSKAAAALLAGLLFSFSFFVCPQRDGAIRTLYQGYLNNFLLKIVEHDSIDVIVVDPGAGAATLVEGTGLREREDRDWTAAIEKAGLAVAAEKRGHPDDPRTLYVVRRKGAAAGAPEVGVDFSRNVFALHELLCNERTGTLDRMCGVEAKYRVLTEGYFGRLEAAIRRSGRLGGRVRLLRGATAESVVAEIERRLAAAEAAGG